MVSSFPDSTRTQPDPPGLHVEVIRDRHQHVTTVYVNGYVDLATADLLSAAADLALRSSPLRVLVDLSEVSFFSAAGLTVLLSLRERAERAAVDLVLRAPSPAVLNVLDIVSAAPCFRIAPAGFRSCHRGQSLASSTAT